ncbi:MAG: helix-turn-helix transcriptional regulator [Candidatus Saccharimonadales bacterium]
MNAIRSYREKHGLSQTEFGQMVGVRQTAISNYEIGFRTPNIRIAKRIHTKTNGALPIHVLRPDIFGVDEPAPSMGQEAAA